MVKMNSTMVTLQTDTKIERVISTRTMAYSGSDSGSTAGPVTPTTVVAGSEDTSGGVVGTVLAAVPLLFVTSSSIMMSCVEVYDGLALHVRAQVTCKYQNFESERL